MELVQMTLVETVVKHISAVAEKVVTKLVMVAPEQQIPGLVGVVGVTTAVLEGEAEVEL